MDQLTDEQIEHWRKAIALSIGPYAFIMPKEEIERISNTQQERINNLDKIKSHSLPHSTPQSNTPSAIGRWVLNPRGRRTSSWSFPASGKLLGFRTECPMESRRFHE